MQFLQTFGDQRNVAGADLEEAVAAEGTAASALQVLRLRLASTERKKSSARSRMRVYVSSADFSDTRRTTAEVTTFFPLWYTTAGLRGCALRLSHAPVFRLHNSLCKSI